MTIHQILAWAVLIACAGYALSFGGAPERLMSAITLAGCAATLLEEPMSRRFVAVEAWAPVDVLVYLAMLAVVLRANRYWPAWLAAFQAIGTASHLLGTFHSRLVAQAYAVVSQFEIYPMLGILVWGTVRHRERLARIGADRSWSTFFTRLPRMRVNSPAG